MTNKIKKVKKVAKCYAVYGWWRYYRTADGETFAIRDGKYYFSLGNVFTEQKFEATKFVEGDELKELLETYEFTN